MTYEDIKAIRDIEDIADRDESVKANVKRILIKNFNCETFLGAYEYLYLDDPAKGEKFIYHLQNIVKLVNYLDSDSCTVNDINKIFNTLSLKV